MTFASETAAISRTKISIFEITLDFCGNTYGSSPCTATGSAGEECYNTITTCQDKANFTKTTKTHKFCSSKSAPPFPGCYPYIKKIEDLPTEIKETLTVIRKKNIILLDVPDTDVGIDPYIANRTSPASGTFLKRLIARNLNFQGRPVSEKVGYDGLDEADFEERFTGVIDNFKIGRGQITCTVIDLIADLKNVKIPLSLDLELNTDITSTATEIGLKSIPDELPSSGYIKIDDEILSYSTVNESQVRLEGIVHALFGTVAASHDEDTKLTLVEYFAPDSAFAHLKTIAITKGGIAGSRWDESDPDYIAETQTPGGAGNLTLTSSPVTISPSRKVSFTSDADESGITITVTGKDNEGLAQVSAAFAGPNNETIRATDADGVELYWSEVSQEAVSGAGTGNITSGIIDGFDFWQEYPEEDIDYTAIIIESLSADELFFELVNQANLVVWQNEEQKITCRRLFTNDPLAQKTTVTDAANIIEKSGKVDLNTKARITRVVQYWDRQVLEDGDQPDHFNAIKIAIDADAEGANEYNDIVDDVIYGRWFRRGVLADGVASDYIDLITKRRLRQRRDPPLIISASLELKDEGLKTGDSILLTSDKYLDFDGTDLSDNFFVISRKPRDDNRIDYKFKRLPLQKVGIIAPVDFGDPDYIAEAQTPGGAGNLTLTSSPVVIDPPRKLSVSSDADESGITITVTGKDAAGGAQVSAAFTGPNVDEVVAVDGSSNELVWSEVSQEAVSGAGTGNITSGIFNDYDIATDADKEYGIICDDNGVLDGLHDPGYTIY